MVTPDSWYSSDLSVNDEYYEEDDVEFPIVSMDGQHEWDGQSWVPTMCEHGRSYRDEYCARCSL